MARSSTPSLTHPGSLSSLSLRKSGLGSPTSKLEVVFPRRTRFLACCLLLSIEQCNLLQQSVEFQSFTFINRRNRPWHCLQYHFLDVALICIHASGLRNPCALCDIALPLSSRASTLESGSRTKTLSISPHLSDAHCYFTKTTYARLFDRSLPLVVLSQTLAIATVIRTCFSFIPPWKQSWTRETRVILQHTSGYHSPFHPASTFPNLSSVVRASACGDHLESLLKGPLTFHDSLSSPYNLRP